MENDRLLLLADHLEKVPKDEFDMEVWGLQDPNACGFAACAMGHACSIPQFKDLGLSLVWRHSSPGHTNLADVILDKGTRERREFGMSAAATLFNLSYRQAEYLFSSGDEDVAKDPAEEAFKIRNFVKEEGFCDPLWREKYLSNLLVANPT